MAIPSFAFSVQVRSGAPVALPVELSTDSIDVDGTTPAVVDFTIRNTHGTAVEFSSVSIERSGTHANQVIATVLSDAFSIPAGGQQANRLTIEPTQVLPVDAAITIQVSGTGREVAA